MAAKTPAQELNAREHKLIAEAKRLSLGVGLPKGDPNASLVQTTTARLAKFDEERGRLKQTYADVFAAKRGSLANHILFNARAQLRGELASATIDEADNTNEGLTGRGDR